jgi:polysaccharide deacetylase family protein (PEP-CTERM system associated)
MSHQPQAIEPITMSQQPTNYLTVDVEDYFQVAAFEKVISTDNWEQYECRVVANTSSILELFDAGRVKATFFIVGWIAERYPDLVLEIDRQGHEIGCHSYQHQKIYNLTPEQFREDTRRAKETLEQIIGKPVKGYRAPSYSITKKSLWALDILAELGFRYDSSIFPVYHDNYGIPDAPRFAYRLEKQDMMEYPISTVQFPGMNLPIAGGGYFRLFPYWFTRMALRRINRKEKQPFIFYFHPWEVDPEQPRIQGAGAKSRFRHYLNLDKTRNRLEHLLQDFKFGPITV